MVMWAFAVGEPDGKVSLAGVGAVVALPRAGGHAMAIAQVLYVRQKPASNFDLFLNIDQKAGG